LAVALKVHSCGNVDFIATNDIIRGFTEHITVPDGEDTVTIPNFIDNESKLKGRCHEAQATDAFLFFMFAAFAGTLVLGLIGKGGKNGSIV